MKYYKSGANGLVIKFSLVGLKVESEVESEVESKLFMLKVNK